VTDEVADWSGDWVVNEIAARVDRAGPRPVSEDHKPGLVHPDVDWLINYLASSPGDVIIRHVREINYLVSALRYRGRGPVSLVGSTKVGVVAHRLIAATEGLAKQLQRRPDDRSSRAACCSCC
jgi:hypothetical protein